ncbi:helix-turn-helix domain-containing protein [Actinomadura formosensis]|uniref:helix-turn-helix domain-containing protein n=1 Tax=Actinomadura formosensis TaxID=60706 RepID=UPI00083278E9|nr:hypothetical protein [Actinomadura formosensis]
MPVEVLRRRYEAGVSLTVLAGWAGESLSTVRARLVSAGVVLRGRGPRRELAVPLEELRKRYEAGASTTVLAALAGVSAGTVRARLAGAGVVLRRPGPPRVPVAVPVAELRRRYERGETIGDLAAAAGVSYITLRRRLKDGDDDRSGEEQQVTQVPGSGLQPALDMLLEGAGKASRVMSGTADGLTLAEAGAAVEAVTDVLDLLGQMLGRLTDRVEQVAEREVTERRDGSSRERLEAVGVHLSCGCDGLMAARHLLSIGRGDLLTVERGED